MVLAGAMADAGEIQNLAVEARVFSWQLLFQGSFQGALPEDDVVIPQTQSILQLFEGAKQRSRNGVADRLGQFRGIAQRLSLNAQGVNVFGADVLILVSLLREALGTVNEGARLGGDDALQKGLCQRLDILGLRLKAPPDSQVAEQFVGGMLSETFPAQITALAVQPSTQPEDAGRTRAMPRKRR